MKNGRIVDIFLTILFSATSLLIFGLAFLSIAHADTVAFDTDLHYGSTGSEVVALQEFLTDQGVFAGAATGNFYSITLQAVKAFQKAEGIVPVSGYFGIISRGVANQILSMEAPDSEGDATTTQSIVDLSQAQPQAIQPDNVPTAPITVQATVPVVTPQVVFDVYTIKYEASLDDFYYAGPLELQGATINGADASIVTSRYLDDCIVIDGVKNCGYYMARFTGSHTESTDLILTASDGQIHEVSIPSQN